MLGLLVTLTLLPEPKGSSLEEFTETRYATGAAPCPWRKAGVRARRLRKLAVTSVRAALGPPRGSRAELVELCGARGQPDGGTG